MAVFSRKQLFLLGQQLCNQECRDVPQVYDKDIKDLRGSFKFEVIFESTMIVGIAVHSDSSRNHKIKIACLNSIPFPGYKYSTINDTVSVVCCDYVNLGMINVSYKAAMRGTAGWEFKVPLPIPVVRRYLDLEQRRHLKEFQERFKGQDVSFEFLQMISAY